jgi:arsenate reductase
MPRGVLFLCVQNAGRSQMAEGWARRLFPPGVRIASAGSNPAPAINPLAERVMAEVGIDISRQRPSSVDNVPLGDMDTVISLCAEEVCDLPPAGLTMLSWPLDDPEAVQGSEDEKLAAFRKIRDEIRVQLEAMLWEAGMIRPDKAPAA